MSAATDRDSDPPCPARAPPPQQRRGVGVDTDEDLLGQVLGGRHVTKGRCVLPPTRRARAVDDDRQCLPRCLLAGHREAVLASSTPLRWGGAENRVRAVYRARAPPRFPLGCPEFALMQYKMELRTDSVGALPGASLDACPNRPFFCSRPVVPQPRRRSQESGAVGSAFRSLRF
jgi:hypothetical protein